jgi:hypothetical protein
MVRLKKHESLKSRNFHPLLRLAHFLLSIVAVRHTNSPNAQEHAAMMFGKTAVLTLGLLVSSLAQADWSANLGLATDYYYRGIFQATASTNGGIDYENKGFYAGTWIADVKDGLEVDAYFGYGDAVGDLGYSIGYTGYFYTGDFDDTYQEINLGGSLGLFSLDVALGQYDNFAGPTADYTHYALTIEKDGFLAVLGGFEQDFGGQYIQFGYSTTLADFEFGATLLFNSKELSGDTTGDQALIFSIGKSFEL